MRSSAGARRREQMPQPRCCAGSPHDGAARWHTSSDEILHQHCLDTCSDTSITQRGPCCRRGKPSLQAYQMRMRFRRQLLVCAPHVADETWTGLFHGRGGTPRQLSRASVGDERAAWPCILDRRTGSAHAHHRRPTRQHRSKAHIVRTLLARATCQKLLLCTPSFCQRRSCICPHAFDPQPQAAAIGCSVSFFFPVAIPTSCIGSRHAHSKRALLNSFCHEACYVAKHHSAMRAAFELLLARSGGSSRGVVRALLRCRREHCKRRMPSTVPRST